jgi:hypothetical protein
MVQKTVRHVSRLVTKGNHPPISLLRLTHQVPRIITRVIHEEPVRAIRPRWHNKRVESPLPHLPRIHLPLNLRHPNLQILPLPPQPHRRRLLLGPHPPLRHTLPHPTTRPQNPTHRDRTYPPGVQFIVRRDTGRQHDYQCVDRWSHVCMDNGYARPTTRIPRTRSSTAPN